MQQLVGSQVFVALFTDSDFLHYSQPLSNALHLQDKQRRECIHVHVYSTFLRIPHPTTLTKKNQDPLISYSHSHSSQNLFEDCIPCGLLSSMYAVHIVMQLWQMKQTLTLNICMINRQRGIWMKPECMKGKQLFLSANSSLKNADRVVNKIQDKLTD